MNNPVTTTQTVIIERDFAHPPEKIWRALTEPHLIEEWLMKNDFKPLAGSHFDLRADWGSVACEVLAIEPLKTLTYSWTAFGLESVVTWTLTPTATGTHLRLEHSGFDAAHQPAYHGAQHGWQQFVGKLEQLLART